ncbi:hypothetical protein MTO96_008748 [Rhipicephalus appendiculatus]
MLALHSAHFGREVAARSLWWQVHRAVSPIWVKEFVKLTSSSSPATQKHQPFSMLAAVAGFMKSGGKPVGGQRGFETPLLHP